MSIEEYVANCWRLHEQYVQNIQADRIVSSKWIKLAVARYLTDLTRDDLFLDRDKVEKVFKFFYYINLDENRLPFPLLPFQAFFIVNVFGFYRSNGKRRYRTTFLFMARKNGKTSLAAAFQLYMMFDGDPIPRSLLIARSQEQAALASDYCAQMISKSPALAKRFKSQGSSLVKSKIVFRDPKKFGNIRTLPSQSEKLQGYNPSASILDEIHTYPDQSLYTSVKKGMKTRQNPILFLISTAGSTGSESFCADMVSSAKAMLEGHSKDDTFFPLLYTLDDGDDITNPTVWQKSNPALGAFLDLDDMISSWEEVRLRPSLRADFLTYDLNVFTNETQEWIPDPYIVQNMQDLQLDDFAGQPCMLGIDLSSTRDLTSFVLTFHNEETNHYYIFPWFFAANNPEKRIRKNSINLDDWIQEGYIIESQKKTIDYEVIYETIFELSQKFEIKNVAYDIFNSAWFIPKLQEIIPISTVFQQTSFRFNEPLKFIEKLIFDNAITLQASPVLRWNFANAVLYRDGNGNIKILKNKSKDAVDGVVSIAMSISGWIEYYNTYAK
jgi:phage terminase large subunit-like protein